MEEAISPAIPVLGGLGLFLIGMALMTDGLKLAAGRALERVLARWTSTPARALLTGLISTAAVQSSSGITLATIGFVNAGLLTLNQALWAIFGSNLGTTLTGWLVAGLGFRVEIDALALPLIGIGALMRILAPGVRLRALGTALAGFGLLFAGIDMLREGFVGAGPMLEGAVTALPGIAGMLAMLALGFAMTVVMQSSSAAIAVVITAAGGGVLPLESAAAAVIGANVGTTSTAVLGALGATANARRVATGHVAFNLVAAAVALALMPLWAWGLGMFRLEGAEGLTAAVALALFHTLFNGLGILLMVPLAPHLERWLAGRFVVPGEALARLRHLDDNVLAVPDLALDALAAELRRLAEAAVGTGREAFGGGSLEAGCRTAEGAEGLARAITRQVGRLGRQSLPGPVAEGIGEALGAVEDYRAMLAMIGDAARLRGASLDLGDGVLERRLRAWREDLDEILLRSLPGDGGFDPEAAGNRLAGFEENTRELRAMVLRVGAEQDLDLAGLESAMDLMALGRRIARRAVRSARVLGDLSSRHPQPPGISPDS